MTTPDPCTRTVTHVEDQYGRFLTTLSPCGHRVLVDQVYAIGDQVICSVCQMRTTIPFYRDA